MRLLFEDASESVWVEDGIPDAKVEVGNEDGLEFLVTDGMTEINDETCNAQS